MNKYGILYLDQKSLIFREYIINNALYQKIKYLIIRINYLIIGIIKNQT